MEGGCSPTFINSRDTEIVLQLSLVMSLPEVVVVWHYSKDGQFIVKSAYHIGMDCASQKDGGAKSSEEGNAERKRCGSHCGSSKYPFPPPPK